ncbi:MORN repeat-containing protein [Saccharibacillus alkalitolerans]|uniref:MORN repeat-containing protein n=1 Tax=Saccharibacillus alkalitolerans TaxID=2705290 RepID=A0ABX0FAT3_9BACL|nr:hypothetical protein [Saccharibacillus alkalitolerans]NGZ77070.1 hypothetical protein [Saccharibacillus alkalitolerans]
MKKKLALLLALALPLGAAVPAGEGSPSAEAASAKQWLQLSSRATYYGEVANGQPNGQGTIRWGDDKYYSGSFAYGKRSGRGKYVNAYVDGGTQRQHRVVYQGSWSGDAMNGSGTRTEQVKEADGSPFSDGIEVGVFRANELNRGYKVVHAMADPDYSFSYRAKNYRLDILGSNVSLVSDWKTGTLFDVRYRKGSISRSYSLFQGSTDAEEKARLASLKYLRGVTDEVTPILWRFRALSERLTLK